MSEAIVYRGIESYLANMRAILAPLERDFKRVLNSCNQLGFLTPSEAAAMRLPVHITTTDESNPRSQDLPHRRRNWHFSL